MKEEDIVFERGRFWVLRERSKGGVQYVVCQNLGCYSVSDSAYPGTEDGKSLAIARARYLSRRPADLTPHEARP